MLNLHFSYVELLFDYHVTILLMVNLYVGLQVTILLMLNLYLIIIVGTCRSFYKKPKHSNIIKVKPSPFAFGSFEGIKERGMNIKN